jgi:putative serine protease PepD
MTSGQAGDQARAPVLVARIGRQQHVFPVGMQIRVGRDPELELVSVNPLVSRDTHGLITSDEKGAVYTDRSRRGTFLDGKRLNGPLRITESVILRLGDPATGEELGITPPLSSAELESNRERRVRRGRIRVAAIAAGALVVAGGIAAGTLAVIGSPASSGKQPVTTRPGSALAHAEDATVRLLQGSQSAYSGWGSGTAIAPDGLILTNAHVAEPQAPGLAVALGEPQSQLEPNPPYLTVELTTGPASPVNPRYRARPVAVDGYLDLAVVKIYATSDGTPVNPATLHLPYLNLGNDAAVQLDQTVTVLGFPGVADSDSITVTSGVISTFVPDPLGHVTDPRFELETTARLAHGNSGGAAINDAGQLIGVPSLEVTGEGGDLSWRLRSVTEAQLLIAAAKAGKPYHSKILVQRTGAEHLTGVGVGDIQPAACAGHTTLPSATSAWFGVSFGGVPAGLDLATLIELPDGSAVTTPTGGLPQFTATASTGCFVTPVSAQELGLAELPSGTYQIQLYGGPTLAPIGTATAVSVGDRGPTGAPTGTAAAVSVGDRGPARAQRGGLT